MGDAGMPTAFLPFQSYKIQLLFQGWNVQEPWQFALTFLAIVLMGATVHVLECVSLSMKNSMIATLIKSNNKPDMIGEDGSRFAVATETNDSQVKKMNRPTGWCGIKVINGVLAGLRYSLTLILMLVVMSFNPLLFMALLMGNFVGDFICCDFHINMKMGVYNTPSGSLADNFVKKVLCIKQIAADFTPDLEMLHPIDISPQAIHI